MHSGAVTTTAYVILYHKIYLDMAINQGLDFDDMSSFFPCILCDALKYINLRYELLVTDM
jgi:hypothetical protein